MTNRYHRKVTRPSDFEPAETFQKLSVTLPPSWIRNVRKHGHGTTAGASGVIREALALWALENDVVLSSK
ncbi:hypothetical protein [Synechococcus sp. ROS8604]|uniref:hypothetical protein n=1 Tax=Synechococcus sp. ROS8604 TaxID=1442557 RepID=UPI00164503E6|nr:hypothetical protein [Synechococcus sp. ROS8604]QNI89559.1 hypothetical protein SynROS8604_02943 [Synechococcus sp. ROS8604]